jgi:hypothetical protein
MIRRSACSTAGRPPRAGGRLAAEAARSLCGERSAGLVRRLPVSHPQVRPPPSGDGRGAVVLQGPIRANEESDAPRASDPGGLVLPAPAFGQAPEARRRKAPRFQDQMQAGNGKQIEATRVLRKEPHRLGTRGRAESYTVPMPARACRGQVTATPETAVAGRRIRPAAARRVLSCRKARRSPGRGAGVSAVARRNRTDRESGRLLQADASPSSRGSDRGSDAPAPGQEARIAVVSRTTRTSGTVGPSPRTGETAASTLRAE